MKLLLCLFALLAPSVALQAANPFSYKTVPVGIEYDMDPNENVEHDNSMAGIKQAFAWNTIPKINALILAYYGDDKWTPLLQRTTDRINTDKKQKEQEQDTRVQIWKPQQLASLVEPVTIAYLAFHDNDTKLHAHLCNTGTLSWSVPKGTVIRANQGGISTYLPAPLDADLIPLEQPAAVSANGWYKAEVSDYDYAPYLSKAKNYVADNDKQAAVRMMIHEGGGSTVQLSINNNKLLAHQLGIDQGKAHQ